MLFIQPNWLKCISIEPAAFFFTVGRFLLEFGNINLYLQKGCRINATVEPSLSTPCDDTEKGVLIVGDIHSYIISIKMILVVILLIAYCSWSDKAGGKRKFFLMSAMIGQLIESGFGCMHSYYWTWDVKFAALSSAAWQVIFGNFATFHVFSLMYLADIVNVTNRTMRFGILITITTCATLLAKSVSGFLLNARGFSQYYAVCAAISLLAVCLGQFFIEDVSVATTKKVSYGSIFNFKGHATESVKIVFGKRNRRQNIIVLLLLVVHSGLLFAHEGIKSQFTCI